MSRDPATEENSAMPNAVIEGAQHVLSGPRNLSLTERSVSIAGGLALAAVAAQPRPNKWLSLAALVVGVGLAVRGATGHCAVKAAITGEDGSPRLT
jgi:uncharacterized membrane protein